MVIKFPEVENNDDLPAFSRKNVITQPVEDIGVVILDHKQITITTGALEALLENKAAITCNSQHMPTGLMLPFMATPFKMSVLGSSCLPQYL